MKNVKKIISAALITIFATSLVGCNMIEKTPEGIAKSVVAKVYDAKITRGQVDEQLVGLIEQLKTQYGDNYQTNAEAMASLDSNKTQALEGLINEVIVNQKAKDLKVVPTEAKLTEEINKQLAEIKKSLKTDAAYKEALAGASLTEATLKERIRPSVIQEALSAEVTKDVKVTEAQEKTYYDANLTQFTEGTVHLAHILVATEADAVAVKKRLDAGEDFAKVAKEKSTDTGSKDAGGDLGTLDFSDTSMDPTFMAAGLKLESGKISDPVQTQFGYHIIKSIEKKSSPAKKFETVKAEIETTLIAQEKQKAWTAAMTKWTTEAKITKYEKNLK
ncbi:peptidylprolyl isomerase [Clostridium sp.]|uniref:peptidylprolyl isomerase n=1 Tax=Clostridium sp. TaxID=1506 RepID=UPI001A4F7AAD|nr:peptidylprolyl isomerase [Clostridium sp.]MBK5234433.1 peptidylprolyl isomerase [Clostridium sp.]